MKILSKVSYGTSSAVVPGTFNKSLTKLRIDNRNGELGRHAVSLDYQAAKIFRASDRIDVAKLPPGFGIWLNTGHDAHWTRNQLSSYWVDADTALSLKALAKNRHLIVHLQGTRKWPRASCAV